MLTRSKALGWKQTLSVTLAKSEHSPDSEEITLLVIRSQMKVPSWGFGIKAYKERLDSFAAMYYEMRGWDVSSGFDCTMRTIKQSQANFPFGTLSWIKIIMKKRINRQAGITSSKPLTCCLTSGLVREKADSSTWSDEQIPADLAVRVCFVRQDQTQRDCSYLKEVLLCTDMLNKCTLVQAISIYPPPPWSDLPILHHCPPRPRSAAAAVKRHAFIKCLPFQLLSSHVIFLLDHNLRPPPVSCIRSTADARGRWPALVLIWHGLN